MLQVTFAEVSRLLHGFDSEAPAAEGHGRLCGALCVNAAHTFERWREELLGMDEQSDMDEMPLHLLFSGTAAALSEATEEFAPLLPDDDVALEQRTHALAQWASGFLYGFGTALPRSEVRLPANVDEILSDFGRIAAATVDADSDTEEQEQAYAELVEYVRAGVWLLYGELTPLRAAVQDAVPESFN
jgi:uncharacterized protein